MIRFCLTVRTALRKYLRTVHPHGDGVEFCLLAPEGLLSKKPEQIKCLYNLSAPKARLFHSFIFIFENCWRNSVDSWQFTISPTHCSNRVSRSYFELIKEALQGSVREMCVCVLYWKSSKFIIWSPNLNLISNNQKRWLLGCFKERKLQHLETLITPSTMYIWLVSSWETSYSVHTFVWFLAMLLLFGFASSTSDIICRAP